MSPAELLAAPPAVVSAAPAVAPRAGEAEAFGLALAAAGARPPAAAAAPGGGELTATELTSETASIAEANGLAGLTAVLVWPQPQLQVSPVAAPGRTGEGATLAAGSTSTPFAAPAGPSPGAVLTPAAFVESGLEPSVAATPAFPTVEGGAPVVAPPVTAAAPNVAPQPSSSPAVAAAVTRAVAPLPVSAEAGLVRLAARTVEPAPAEGDSATSAPPPPTSAGSTVSAPVQAAATTLAPTAPRSPEAPTEPVRAPDAAPQEGRAEPQAAATVAPADAQPAPTAAATAAPGSASWRLADPVKAPSSVSAAEAETSPPSLSQAADAPASAAPPALDRAEAARSLIAPTAAATVQHLAAEIARRLEGRSTRFELELHPADLGRVDVRLDVSSDGRVQAQLAFDNPVAAADLRARADELRKSLEQAGFQVAREDLSFAERDGRGSGFAQGRGDDGRPARGRAFQSGLALADAADAPARTSLSRSALDVRV